ncbi:MAG: antibiotic biosynthesis monooxygenase [Dehalococcoidia bacterium]|nr:antibiotic biosynthesis monooxygenase [Dehalococcoidia bacterium]
MHCVAATYVIKAGHENDVIGPILEAQRLSRQEPGVIAYQAHRSATDPRVFFLYEAYRDDEAFKAHLKTDHFKQIILKQVVPFIEKRETGTYIPLDAD